MRSARSMISGPKGYFALGAFNAQERATALDMLGFSRQLVFATFSEGIAFYEGRPLDIRYAAARAPQSRHGRILCP